MYMSLSMCLCLSVCLTMSLSLSLTVYVYLSGCFSSNEYSGLISFRIDWFDLLAVQGTLKSLLQHHSSKASVLHIRWPKYWSFSFSISPSSEYLGLISLRMDWLDLLAVQGTLKSLLQHHSSKASILRRSAFFIVQFSHPYMTTRKTIALTRQTFVGKVMSLLFIMLSRLVIAFLPGSKCLLISWLQSPSAVTLLMGDSVSSYITWDNNTWVWVDDKD